MGINPPVRVILEGTGEELGYYPPFTALPAMNGEIEILADGGGAKVYKVEKVRHVLDTTAHTGGPGASKNSVYAKVVITVSLVP